MMRWLAVLSLILVVLPVHGTGPLPGWTKVQAFSCGTGEGASEGTLELFGGDTGAGIQTLQFTEEDHGVFTPPWPEDGYEGNANFFLSSSQGEEGHYFQVRWQDGAVTKYLYSLDRIGMGDDTGGGESGLIELDADGKVQRQVLCTERRHVDFDALEFMTSCDDANPYGASGCTIGDERTRAEPLVLPGGISLR